MGLLDSNYSAVNGKKPRNSGRMFAGEELNGRGLLDAATNIPVVGDALSGGMAIYDAAKGDYGSAAMNALGVLPFVSGSMVAKGSKVADAVSGKKLTEFEQRHLTAQKNAALPVEQGGLGLPEGNTAMDRAKAMGFDTPAYHGTGDDRVARSRQFKDSMLGKNTRVEDAKKGHFTASTGEAASEYTWNNGDMTGNVLPLLLRGERDTKRIPGEWIPGSYDSFIDSAKQSGKEGVTITGATTLGNPSDVHVTFNPANIRSRFAAFDPMRRHEADLLGYADPRLLAGIAGGGLLGLGGYSLMGDK